MKAFKSLLVACLALSLNASAQNGEKAMDDVLVKACSCVKVGDATCIGTYFGASVSLDLLGSENIYGKEQAVQVLKDFFSKYKSKTFSTPHRGGQQVRYVVGTLSTHGGESFRVSIFVKLNAGEAQVQRIIIEKG